MERKKIAIVGGGITGLAAAYYIHTQTKHHDHPPELTILEKSAALGGKIDTLHHNDFTIERGADSFLARKPAGMKLIEDLGLGDALVYNETGQAYVHVHGRLHSIPAGSYMGIPVAEGPFWETELLSTAGKNRVLEETSIPKGESSSDQSLGYFLRRRFGDELVENLMEPLLSGIYSSDIDQMGLMSTFPQFYELEQQYGSVLKGLRETMPSKRTGTGKKPSQFVSLENGLQTVIDELVRAIGKENIHTEKAVQHISRRADKYSVYMEDGSTREADNVILAIPHQAVPALFNKQEGLRPLQQIPVSSVANITLAYDADAIKTDLDGTGFVVSRNSNFRITACTWTHRKWPHTTPDGKVLLRLYVGKPDDQDVVTLPDAELASIALKDIRKIMDIDGDPEFSVVSRWENMMPQYMVGHTEIVAEVRDHLQKHMPGIILAGSSYEGVGIPDCIASAQKAAQAGT